MKNNTYIELINDPFYQEYSIYTDSVIDYFIIKNESINEGIKTHQEILIYIISLLSKKYEISYNHKPDKMKANKITKEDLFNESYNDLFLKPPYGNPFIKKYIDQNKKEIIIQEQYTIEDFNHLNNLLFPNGKENLDIYKWTTNWSNYFDEGNEWWGSKCITIYDKNSDRYVIILASATD